MRLIKVAFVKYVVELASLAPVKFTLVEISTSNRVTFCGLLLRSHARVSELIPTIVHVEESVTGGTANVAVVIYDVQTLELPSMIVFTRA